MNSKFFSLSFLEHNWILETLLACSLGFFLPSIFFAYGNGKTSFAVEVDQKLHTVLVLKYLLNAGFLDDCMRLISGIWGSWDSKEWPLKHGQQGAIESTMMTFNSKIVANLQLLEDFIICNLESLVKHKPSSQM